MQTPPKRANPAVRKPAAVLAALLLLVVGGFLIFRRFCQAPAPGFLPGEGSTVATSAWLGLRFGQVVMQAEVEARLLLSPISPYLTRWDGNTLWLIPQPAWDEGAAYTLTLGAGALTEAGLFLDEELEWHFSVRQPGVAYLSTARAERSLWFSALDGSAPYRLSLPDQRVIDFGPAADGNRLVYAAENGEGGSDLWLVDRNARGQGLLLSCGARRCSSPAWSPDGARVAYSQADAAEVGARLRWIDLKSRHTSPVIQDDNLRAAEIRWSPDGRFLSFYDPQKSALCIYDIAANLLTTFPTQVQSAGAWSPDGARFFYIDLDTSILPPLGAAYELEIPIWQATRLFSSGKIGADYRGVVPSPSGDFLLVGRRVSLTHQSVELWLMSGDGRAERPLSTDLTVTRGAYSWDAAGRRVVFQQLALGSSSAEPDVYVWGMPGDTIQLVARQAALPRWLP